MTSNTTIEFRATCDLYDEHPDSARVPGIALSNLGGRRQFCGSAVTVKCFEDNSRIKELVATPATVESSWWTAAALGAAL